MLPAIFPSTQLCLCVCVCEGRKSRDNIKCRAYFILCEKMMVDRKTNVVIRSISPTCNSKVNLITRRRKGRLMSVCKKNKFWGVRTLQKAFVCEFEKSNISIALTRQKNELLKKMLDYVKDIFEQLLRRRDAILLLLSSQAYSDFSTNYSIKDSHKQLTFLCVRALKIFFIPSAALSRFTISFSLHPNWCVWHVSEHGKGRLCQNHDSLLEGIFLSNLFPPRASNIFMPFSNISRHKNHVLGA